MEGRNIEVDTRRATADVESMKRFAKEVVALRPNLIVTIGTLATAAMQQQTTTIPIIFANVSDPVTQSENACHRRGIRTRTLPSL